MERSVTGRRRRGRREMEEIEKYRKRMGRREVYNIVYRRRG